MHRTASVRALLGVAAMAAIAFLVSNLAVEAILGSPDVTWAGLSHAPETGGALPADETGSRPFEAARIATETVRSLDATRSADTSAGAYLAYNDEPPADTSPQEQPTPWVPGTPDGPGGQNGSPGPGEPESPNVPGNPGTPGTPPTPGSDTPPVSPAKAVWVWGMARTPGGSGVAGVTISIQGTETSATTGPSGLYVLPEQVSGSEIRLRVDVNGLRLRTVGSPTVRVALPDAGGVRVDFLLEPRGNYPRLPEAGFERLRTRIPRRG